MTAGSAARPATREGGALVRGGACAVPVVAFAALAGFAAAHWSTLVVDPPAARVLLVVLLTTAGGAAAARVRRSERHPWRAATWRAALLALAAGAALAAMGLPVALLWPGGWGELADGLARGLAGLRTPVWPYDGPDPWVRLTILLAVPVVLWVAAALAFLPVRRGRTAARAAGLGLPVALYGVAAAQQPPAAPLVQGIMLLGLLGAWLFLPRVRRRGALAATAMLLVALGASLPVAAGVPAEEPVLDYRSWRWLGDPTSYDWDHGYGPIDWPRRGETVLTVESERPHYWKAVGLDRFDGLRWVRSEVAASAGPDPGIPAPAPERWETEVTVTVGALDSTLLVAPGSVRGMEGAGTVTATRDGGARAEEELEQGSTYTVRAYAPNPRADRMRAAPEPAAFAVRPYTLVHLPSSGTDNLDALEDGEEDEASAAGRPVHLPRYGDGLGATPGAERYVLESPYARVYKLSRRLVAGASTTYDAVRRVEAHLRGAYGYSEDPPDREYPLAAFLFRDRRGYCQQFSGAMALMLRMNGIPARVAAGFAPGARSSEREEFTVRDLDAHSWVEVHFAGIGWVPFDPTPSAAPADSRADETLASAARGDAGQLEAIGLAEALEAEGADSGEALGRPGSDVTGGDGGRGERGGGERGITAALLAAALLGAGGLYVTGRRRTGRGPDAAVLELEHALRRLGHPVAPGTTLVDIERRLAAEGRGAAARYVRRVREHRFAGGRRPVDRGARRALRAALTEGEGPLRRVQGYAVLPPARR